MMYRVLRHAPSGLIYEVILDGTAQPITVLVTEMERRMNTRPEQLKNLLQARATFVAKRAGEPRMWSSPRQQDPDFSPTYPGIGSVSTDTSDDSTDTTADTSAPAADDKPFSSGGGGDFGGGGADGSY